MLREVWESLCFWWTATKIATNYGVPYELARRVLRECNGEDHRARSRLIICRIYNRRYEDQTQEYWDEWESHWETRN